MVRGHGAEYHVAAQTFWNGDWDGTLFMFLSGCISGFHIRD